MTVGPEIVSILLCALSSYGSHFTQKFVYSKKKNRQFSDRLKKNQTPENIRLIQEHTCPAGDEGDGKHKRPSVSSPSLMHVVVRGMTGAQ